MTTAQCHDLTQDPLFPEQVIKATAEREGLRHLLIGEDGNYIVILGHPAMESAAALIRHLDEGLEGDDPITGKDLDYTWGRLLLSCPDHKDEQEGCTYCICVTAEEWWLDWENGGGNQGQSGYFPVVVWETGA